MEGSHGRLKRRLLFSGLDQNPGGWLEGGKVKLQSRLEQEEEAKSALLARIQRLTKLIQVSTKATRAKKETLFCGRGAGIPLLYRRRDVMLDNESNKLLTPGEGFGVTLEDSLKEEKKNQKD